MNRFFITGAGGVGKTFTARCFADMLIRDGGTVAIIDLEHRQDLCGPGGFENEPTETGETIAISHPIREEDDWNSLHDKLPAEAREGGGAGVVVGFPEFWSLPEESRKFGIIAMQILGALPVWVMDHRPTSVNGLEMAVQAFPAAFEKGVVIRNRKQKDFTLWDKSAIRERLVGGQDGFAWKEVDLPVLNAYFTRKLGNRPHHTMLPMLRESKEQHPMLAMSRGVISNWIKKGLENG